MKHIVTIGEALIDFIPQTSGVSLSEVEGFSRKAGGAPANVAAAVAKLGGVAYFIGKVGRDAFGEVICRTLRDAGVRTNYISETDDAHTTLAFVSLTAEGDRDFAFYRNPSADILLAKGDIPLDLFEQAPIVHFGSLSLTDEPSRTATLFAIKEAKARDCVISYDPNLRPPLWSSLDVAREQILAAMPLADIVKLSEDELVFLVNAQSKRSLNTQEAIEPLAIDFFREYPMTCLIVTLGSKGCLYVTEQFSGHCPSVNVQPVDTTGAGDAFVGGLLFRIAQALPSRHSWRESFQDEKRLYDHFYFANAVAAFSTTQFGAIDSYPDFTSIQTFIKSTD